jgi:hypothetical protein
VGRSTTVGAQVAIVRRQSYNWVLPDCAKLIAQVGNQDRGLKPRSYGIKMEGPSPELFSSGGIQSGVHFQTAENLTHDRLSSSRGV